MMNSMGGDDLPDLDGADDEVLSSIHIFSLLHIVLFFRLNILYYIEIFFEKIYQAEL